MKFGALCLLVILFLSIGQTNCLPLIINKHFNLSEALFDFLHDIEVGKELAQPEIKKNYVNFLTHFKNNTSTFNAQQCTYVEKHFPAFSNVETIINNNIGWVLIDHLKLTSEKIELIASSKTLSEEEWKKQDLCYNQKFQERLEVISNIECKAIHSGAIKEVSEKMLDLIENTNFIDLGAITLAVTTPQVLERNGLVNHAENIP